MICVSLALFGTEWKYIKPVLRGYNFTLPTEDHCNSSNSVGWKGSLMEWIFYLGAAHWFWQCPDCFWRHKSRCQSRTSWLALAWAASAGCNCSRQSRQRWIFLQYWHLYLVPPATFSPNSWQIWEMLPPEEDNHKKDEVQIDLLSLLPCIPMLPEFQSLYLQGFVLHGHLDELKKDYKEERKEWNLQWTWTMIRLDTGEGTPFWAMQRYAPPSALVSFVRTKLLPSIPSLTEKMARMHDCHSLFCCVEIKLQCSLLCCQVSRGLR